MTTPKRISSRVVRANDTELIRRFSRSIVGVSPKADLILKAAKFAGRFGAVIYPDDCEDCCLGFCLGHVDWPTEVKVDWLVVPMQPKDLSELLVSAVVAGLREDYQGIQVAVRSRYGSEDDSLEFLAVLKKAAKGDLTRVPDDSLYYRLPTPARDARLPAGLGQSYQAKVASRSRGRGSA
jgi:hypothetical protein